MVIITASFTKNYVLFVNQFIDQIEKSIASYKLAKESSENEVSFISFIDNKINEALLQKSQLMQQIEKVKACKEGDSFLLSTLDGQVSLEEGSDLLNVLAPVIVKVEDSKVTSIAY